MNILYISNFIDDKYFSDIFNNAKEKPMQNMQKFNKLLVNGISQNDNVKRIDVLTAAPVNRTISDKYFFKGKNVKQGKIKFNYLPFINMKLIKQICMAFFSFFWILIWCIFNASKNSILISDGFYPIVSTIASILCKIFGIKVVTLYTDLTKFDVNDVVKSKNKLEKFIKKIINIGDDINVKLSDMFILLTEQMNEVVNKKNKPYIVIEGFVDSNFKIEDTQRKNIIMYAGWLNEKYGVKLLIDAFTSWNNKNYELWLFGDGELVDYIKKIKNKNIKYFGVLPNEKIVKSESEAMLLVNPRFTNELYTKYSFPSKNMEYMASGTPLLTTKLAGMPKEYNDYVYLIENETKQGIIDKLNEIFSKTKKDLIEFGKKTQEFVLKHKNNVAQGNKIIDFITKNSEKNNKIRNTFIFFLITYFLLLNGRIINNVEICIFVLTSIFVFIFVNSLINYKKRLPLIFFLIVFFTFTMGQYYFPNVTKDFMYYKNFNDVYVIKTIYIQYLALLFTYFGYKFLENIKFNKNLEFNSNTLEIYKKIIFIGLLITGISSILINLEMSLCAIKNGYLSLYNGQYVSIFPSIILRISNYYFIFFSFFIALSKNKKMIFIAFIIFLLNSVINFLAGMRFEFVFGFLFLIFYYIYYHIKSNIVFPKKVKKISIIIVLLIPIFLIGLSSYNKIRNKVEIKDINLVSEFGSFFVSQGRSVNLITYAQIYEKELKKTNTNYIFGLFIDSLIDKIDLITLGKFDLDYDKKHLNFGEDISKLVLGDALVKKGHGLGSQYLAEIYIEYDIIGIMLFSFGFGLLISIIYITSSKNIISQILLFNLLLPILHAPRSLAFEFFAPFVSTIIILLLIILFALNNIVKKYKTGVVI